MFPVLKSLVNYIIGQKVPKELVNLEEEAPESKDFDEKHIFLKQSGDNVCEQSTFEECAIEVLEREVREIEGWKVEEGGIDVKDTLGINEEAVENDTQIQNTEPDIDKNESDTNICITSDQKDSIEFPSENDFELCEHRVGTVTKLFKDYGIIDEKLRFSYETIETKNLREGICVNYIVFRRHVDEEWQLHKIVDVTDENWDEKQQEAKSKIVKKSGAINRKMIGQVERKNDQEIFVKPNIKFSLDCIESDFIPIEGDWLSISALVEVDENVQDFVGDVLAVHKIQPLRSKVISGFVTSWDVNRNEGIVDKDVWFTKTECEPGYLPVLEDAVVVQAIESTQGIFTWRAICITSLMGNRPNKPDHKTNSNGRNNMENYVVSACIRNGISVPKKINFGRIGVGQSKEHSLEMSNVGNDHRVLIRGRFHGKKADSQITLLTKIDDGSIVGPGQKIICRFSLYGKFIGSFTEVFVFTFKGFKMTCFIEFEVQDENIMGLIEHVNTGGYNWKNNYSRIRSRHERNGIKLKGVQPQKAPSFIPVKFGPYHVPEYMWKTVLGDNDKDCTKAMIISRVGDVVPCLNRQLTASSYNTRFHTLLHLEEIELNVQIHKFDMEGITLSSVGEYLSLEVPGLSEKRPSLLLGDRVNVITTESGPEYEGYIHKVCANEVWLKFHPIFHQSYQSEEVNVHFVVGRSPIRRCHIAVDMALKNLGEYVLFPNNIKVREPQLNLLDEDDVSCNYQQKTFEKKNRIFPKWQTCTQPVFASGQYNASQRHPQGPSGAPVYSEIGKQYLSTLPLPKFTKKAVKIKWFNSQLNYYQKQAVRNALKGEARPLPYIIFGPPGTGKTMTLVETILQIYSLIPDSRILVATPSNSSANVIAERLLLSNLLCPGDLVRLVAHHCLEEGTLSDILLPYSTTCDSNAPKDGEKGHITFKLKKSSNATMLGRHRITVGTCVALGQLYVMGFPKGHFTHVCVDEAGQATEPEILIPLCFLHMDWGQAILAGDPRQLGPVVQSKVSLFYGIGYSYLARLLDSNPYRQDTSSFAHSGGFNPSLVTRLLMNYRSLPEILNLPSSLFYESQLQAQVNENGREGSILRLLEKCLPQRDTSLPPSIVFHGVRGMNLQDSDCPSWFNSEELVQVVYYLRDLFQAGLTPDDIGVITPYQKQVQKLRFLINHLGLPSPKIGSVEEFQGQERMVVIVSTVRSSLKYVRTDIRYALGFVASPERLNVALTRARALLIIIGNPHLLAQDMHWNRTLAYCIEQKAYIGSDVPKDFINLSSASSFTDNAEEH